MIWNTSRRERDALRKTLVPQQLRMPRQAAVLQDTEQCHTLLHSCMHMLEHTEGLMRPCFNFGTDMC